MTKQEMNELLRLVKIEHEKFDLSEARAQIWFERFQKLSPKEFGLLVKHVLDTAKFTPSISDFAKADKELYGSRIVSYKPPDTVLSDIDAQMRRQGLHKVITGYGPKGIYWCWSGTYGQSGHGVRHPRATASNVQKVWDRVKRLRSGRSELPRAEDYDEAEEVIF